MRGALFALIAAVILLAVLAGIFYGTPFIRLHYKDRKHRQQLAQAAAEREALEDENEALDEILRPYRKEEDL
jgi:hypothetical protein